MSLGGDSTAPPRQLWENSLVPPDHAPITNAGCDLASGANRDYLRLEGLPVAVHGRNQGRRHQQRRRCNRRVPRDPGVEARMLGMPSGQLGNDRQTRSAAQEQTPGAAGSGEIAAPIGEHREQQHHNAVGKVA